MKMKIWICRLVLCYSQINYKEDKFRRTIHRPPSRVSIEACLHWTKGHLLVLVHINTRIHSGHLPPSTSLRLMTTVTTSSFFIIKVFFFWLNSFEINLLNKKHKTLPKFSTKKHNNGFDMLSLEISLHSSKKRKR